MKYLKVSLTKSTRLLSVWDESIILYALEIAHEAQRDSNPKALATDDLKRINSGETVSFNFANGTSEFSLATDEGLEEYRKQEEAFHEQYGTVTDEEFESMFNNFIRNLKEALPYG